MTEGALGATLMTEDEIVEAVARSMFLTVWTNPEYGWKECAQQTREGYLAYARAALRIALPWTREQALREAAAVCEDYERDGQNTKAYACETADELAARILALTGATDGEKPFTCTYPDCKCPVSFPEGHKPSLATECPRSQGAHP